MLRRSLPLLSSLTLSASALADTFYVGTYTKPGGSQGIYRYELDPTTGAVTQKGLAVTSVSPSFLALHPNGRFIYAVNEGKGGGASAFAIQPDGTLQELNRESPLGDGPTHLAVDREGKNILVANYGGGSVCVLPIQADGTLGKSTGFMQHKGTGPDPRRQKGPHAHGAYVTEDNRRALVPDLGLDKVFLYKFDATRGTLEPSEPAAATVTPGAGPRHLALGAKGRLYIVNEMGNTVSVQEPDGAGYKEVQTIRTLPADFNSPSTTAEIHLHPNGRFLYVSNRGHESIAIFTVGEDGKLTAAGFASTGGKSPRYFGIHPQGKLLLACNQASGNVVVFKIDEQSGALTPTGEEFKIAEPVSVLFVPAK